MTKQAEISVSGVAMVTPLSDVVCVSECVCVHRCMRVMSGCVELVML